MTSKNVTTLFSSSVPISPNVIKLIVSNQIFSEGIQTYSAEATDLPDAVNSLYRTSIIGHRPIRLRLLHLFKEPFIVHRLTVLSDDELLREVIRPSFDRGISRLVHERILEIERGEWGNRKRP